MLPQGYWFTVLYASVVLVVCLLVCLVGAHIYSRAAFLILLVVTGALLSILISPLVVPPHTILITHHGGGGDNHSMPLSYNVSYTGFNASTLRANLGRK